MRLSPSCSIKLAPALRHFALSSLFFLCELAEFRQNQVDVVINLGDSIDRASKKKNSSLSALSTVLERQHSKLEKIPLKFVLGMQHCEL